MERKIITTADGSKTIQITDWNEQYHSMHGALQEAYHVFIRMGLEHLPQPHLKILEIGFGTGLNALITYFEALKNQRNIQYTGVEAYPVKPAEWSVLEYAQTLGQEHLQPVFEQMHQQAWEALLPLSPHFALEKRQQDFREIDDQQQYDLIYFDAFGARVQPELWTEAIFRRMFHALLPGGVLVTYAAKGSVRRAMQACGFTVERLPGPPGKREMLRATRPAAG